MKTPKTKKERKRPSAKDVLGWVLFVTLLCSIVFSVYMTLITSEIPDVGAPDADVQGVRLRSDYMLMVLQCLLGLIVMFLPSMLERRLHIPLPDFMRILYFVFLYCAIYLGEVQNFYYIIPHWDTFLHGMSAMMLGALGFSLVQILNDSDRASVRLSPRFVGLFAFCFALSVGALWEIYEFSFDGLLGMNMQKFRLEDGTALIGRAALSDTMEDLVTDAIGALIVSVAGSLALHQSKKKAARAARPDSDDPKE